MKKQDQFNISNHYDVMAELDADVHDDIALAKSEVDLALVLIGHVPNSVFLPCFGTGRHIPRLLERGVDSIVGVDLSPKCVAKARRQFEQDSRVELVVGDLTRWRTAQRFGAGLLLGNSFGDVIDQWELGGVTEGVLDPLGGSGTFVMDYIGHGYLDRARARTPSTWSSTFRGIPVNDTRTPRFDEPSSVMSIDVVVKNQANARVLWKGCYQKRVMDDHEVTNHFSFLGFKMARHGLATELNKDYYRACDGDLGMIAKSAWWTGHDKR